MQESQLHYTKDEWKVMQLRGWISLSYHILNTVHTWYLATFISFQQWNTFMDIIILQMKKCETRSKTGHENKVWSSCKMALWDLFIIGIHVQLFGDVEI